jgi:hypothetical protein
MSSYGSGYLEGLVIFVRLGRTPKIHPAAGLLNTAREEVHHPLHDMGTGSGDRLGENREYHPNGP